MTRKSVSGGWKAVVLILLFLSELILCAGILGNLESVCNFLTARGMEFIVTFLHRTLFFLIEIAAAVILIIDTMIAAITRVSKKFPSLMTVLAFVYNDLAVIATVFGLYMFGQPRGWFPYPLAFLIPAITFLLTFICLIDDFIRDPGISEEVPNVTKMAAEVATKKEEKTAPAPAPRREPPKTERPSAEPAFFVTPAEEPTWEAKAEEPEFVPATESVQMPVHKEIDIEPVTTSHIAEDNVAAGAIADVDDLFFAFSNSDYVEDDLSE